MTIKQKIAKELFEAWSDKNEAILRKHMHQDFEFKGPMMAIKGVEANIASLADCPFESTSETHDMVEQDDKLVHVFDWIVSAPFQATIPAVEVMHFDGEQVTSSRMFFDTGLFPTEFLEQMKEMASQEAA